MAGSKGRSPALSAEGGFLLRLRHEPCGRLRAPSAGPAFISIFLSEIAWRDAFHLHEDLIEVTGRRIAG